jgi:MinD superfamily P-loop ATPase
LILSFASGKGGTGKTLLATNLAWMLSERGPTTYVDADVEEPNGHLFLKHEAAQLERVTVTLPELQGSCTGCGVCQKVCAFHAILAMKHRVMVFPELCHACGACVMACPQRVLVERPYEIGSIARARLDHLHLLSGRLDVGQARSTPLVEAVVQAGAREHEGELVIVDSPPGTSCSAMAAVRRADRVVLVTEPTPFGLNDLALAVQMCRAMKRDIVAVVNRSDLGDEEVVRYLEREGIPVLGQIPFDRAIATAYANGALAAARSTRLRATLEAIATHIGVGTSDRRSP